MNVLGLVCIEWRAFEIDIYVALLSNSIMGPGLSNDAYTPWPRTNTSNTFKCSGQ